MTQDPNTLVDFTVASGEQVTVTVQAVNCNCMTTGAFNGTDLTAISNDPDVYQFTFNGNSGDKARFACLCVFQPKDPLFAHYTFQLTGSQGGNFSSTDTPKETPKASKVLFFTIA